MSPRLLLTTQLIFVFLVGIAFAISRPQSKTELIQIALRQSPEPNVVIHRDEPLRISPFYDRPEMVSDEDLAAVLWQVRPKFSREGLRPNLVEHALRAWSVDATFQDETVLSGQQMKEFLLDHSTFLLSWSEESKPLLVETDTGIQVNWGMNRETSVHHDHLLACITEAGVHLNEPVYLPSQKVLTVNDVILEALRDFELDEREAEWTAMAFGLWLAPQGEWTTRGGRRLSFDILAQRLIRGDLEKGVCIGTHRVYSLMLLWRIDQEYDILSDEMADGIYAHLENIRDLIELSQFEDGHWPSNWKDGAEALVNPRDDEHKSKVIATGHHLEWLAIAPPELHPSRELIEKAADWIIDTTVNQSEEYIQANYTFYSHVGNALALWRNTRPCEFWSSWQKAHPDYQHHPPKSVGKYLDLSSSDSH